MHWLQSHMGALAVHLASLITLFGEELVMVVVLGYVYWCHNKAMGVYLGTNFCMAGLWNPMLKNIFIRRRPYFDHADIQCLKPVEAGADLYDINAQGYSFPSGHSSNAATVYGSIARFSGRKGLVAAAIVLTVLVGISRFCLGVHYPTDVFCGWLLGLFAICFIPWLSSRFSQKWKFYLVMVLLSLPGCFYCQTTDYYTALGMSIGFFTGNLFEEKYVRFENTRNPLRILLRLAGGGILYFGLNALLKLPFDPAFLASASPASYAIRVMRYALILFVIVAIYPWSFGRFTRGQSTT